MNGGAPSDPWADLITLDTVVELHGELIARYGGETSAPRSGCIEGSIGAAWNAELYTAAEGSQPGLCFSGCLLFYLLKNHCFIDGNKRIAWAACMEILRVLGLTIDMAQDKAEEYCLGIIEDKAVSATDISFWIARNVKAYSDLL
jgi:death on curing protein